MGVLAVPMPGVQVGFLRPARSVAVMVSLAGGRVYFRLFQKEQFSGRIYGGQPSRVREFGGHRHEVPIVGDAMMVASA